MRMGKEAEERGLIGSLVFQVDREFDAAPALHSEPGAGWVFSWLWFALSWVPGEAVL